jgi:virginiamycin B lyase
VKTPSRKTREKLKGEDTLMNSTQLRTIILCGVLATIGVSPAHAQHFQQIAGASLTQISVGAANNVWGVNAAGQVFRFDTTTKLFDLMPGTLVQVAVGGGNIYQYDDIWGINSAGSIFTFHSGTWQQIYGNLSSIVVGTGFGSCYKYQVWGINSGYAAFHYNYCTASWEGVTGTFLQIATGGNEVWAIDSNHNVRRFNPSTKQFDYMAGVSGTVSQLAVGAGTVWSVYAQTTPVYSLWQFNPSTQNWFGLSGISWQSVAAGGNEVWAMTRMGAVYKVTPSTKSFVNIPGKFTRLAVGGGGGIWALDSAHNVYVFATP